MSSLHTIYFITKHKQSTLLSSSSIGYNFSFTRIRYFIPIAIITHIDCLNNSKHSVRYIFKATPSSLESVTLSIFCYRAQLMVPDASCGESLTIVSHTQRHVANVLSWVLLRVDVFQLSFHCFETFQQVALQGLVDLHPDEQETEVIGEIILDICLECCIKAVQ